MDKKADYIELAPGFIVRREAIPFLKKIFIHPDPCWLLFAKIDYSSSEEDASGETKEFKGCLLTPDYGILIFPSEESAIKHIPFFTYLFNIANIKPQQISWNDLAAINDNGHLHAVVVGGDESLMLLPLIKEI